MSQDALTLGGISARRGGDDVMLCGECARKFGFDVGGCGFGFMDHSCKPVTTNFFS